MFKFLMFFLIASICLAQTSPQMYNGNFVRGVVVVTPRPTFTPSVTLTPTPTPTPQNTPAAGTNTWTPTFTSTPTFTPTITGTPTQTNTPGNIALQNATGANDNWKDATINGTSTPGVGAVYDNVNSKLFDLSLANPSTPVCADQNGNTCTPTPTGSPTGTPTNTPTPQFVANQACTYFVSSFDLYSSGVTIGPLPQCLKTWYIGATMSTVVGAAASTIFADESFDGVHFAGNTASNLYEANIVISGNVANIPLKSSAVTNDCARYIRVRPVATGTQTVVPTIALYGTNY